MKNQLEMDEAGTSEVGDDSDRVEKLLRRRDSAAFIMEPIILNLCVLIPDKEFMTSIRELCTK